MDYIMSVRSVLRRRVKIRLIHRYSSQTVLKHSNKHWEYLRIDYLHLRGCIKYFEQVSKITVAARIDSSNVSAEQHCKADWPHRRSMPPSFQSTLHDDDASCLFRKFLHIMRATNDQQSSEHFSGQNDHCCIIASQKKKQPLFKLLHL